MPGWPRISENGEIQVPLDDEKKIYGQSFICMSLTATQMDQVAEGLRIIRPIFYFNTMDNVLLPHLKRLADEKDKRHRKDPGYLNFSLPLGTNTLSLFFKNPAHHEQIFDIMVATYESPLKVESWGRPYTDSS